MSQLPSAPSEGNPPGYEEAMASSLTSGASWSPPGSYITPQIGWTPETSGTSWTPPVPHAGTVWTPPKPPHIGWNDSGTSPWSPENSASQWSNPGTSVAMPLSSMDSNDVNISKQPTRESIPVATVSQDVPAARVDLELPVTGILAVCPTCRTLVPASVKHKPSCVTHTAAILFCIVGLIPCAFFTYLCPPCMKSDHYCDVCGTKIESPS